MAMSPSTRTKGRAQRKAPPIPGKAIWAIAIVSALLLLADLLYDKHAKFSMEYLFGFYGWFGFAATIALLLLANGLRKLARREEDYYDPPDEPQAPGETARDKTARDGAKP